MFFLRPGSRVGVGAGMNRRELEKFLGREELLDRMEQRYLRALEAGDLYAAADIELAMDRLRAEDDG